MTPDERAAALKRYSDFLEALTSERLPGLTELCAANVRFQDPFNEVQGVERYRQVLEHMYEDVPQVSFTVTARAAGEPLSFLSWRFDGVTRAGKPLVFEGVSEIAFDEEGKVTLHRDHWDAAGALYEKVPVLGAILRAARRRLSTD